MNNKMTDIAKLKEAVSRARAARNHARANFDAAAKALSQCGGHGGSPLEGWHEELEATETALSNAQRRYEKARKK